MAPSRQFAPFCTEHSMSCYYTNTPCIAKANTQLVWPITVHSRTLTSYTTLNVMHGWQLPKVPQQVAPKVVSLKWWRARNACDVRRAGCCIPLLRGTLPSTLAKHVWPESLNTFCFSPARRGHWRRRHADPSRERRDIHKTNS